MKKFSKVIDLLKMLKGQYGLVAVALCLSVFSAFLNLVLPILFGRAIDLFLPSGVDFERLTFLLSLSVAVPVTGAVTRWGADVLSKKITVRLVRTLRCEAVSALVHTSVRELYSRSQGEAVHTVTSDAEAVFTGITSVLSVLSGGVATVVGTLIYMFIVSPWIAISVPVLTPLSVFTAKFITQRTGKYYREQGEIRSRQIALADETLSAEKTVKVCGGEEERVRLFRDANEKLRRSSEKAMFFSALTNPVTRFITSFIYACVLLLGIFAVGGRLGTPISVGTLSVLLAYTNRYTKPFNDIASILGEAQNAMVCYERIQKIRSLPSEEDSGLPFPDCVETIEARDVSFAYIEGKPVLKHLSFTVKAGQKVAIVGKTGCGKTTLIHLLIRFFDCTEGDFYINGQPLSSFSRRSVREKTGLLLQETWIKEDTVRNNIAFGRNANDEEIKHAAVLSEADSFIERMNGYDAKADETTLSQGQKQLLCIARVLLRKPDILLLDEATSSVDVVTEQKIHRAFDTLMQGKTSFVVAHRLSTVKNADLILVMNDGEIVERGTHETLLAQNGLYADLYRNL